MGYKKPIMLFPELNCTSNERITAAIIIQYILLILNTAIWTHYNQHPQFTLSVQHQIK